MSAKPLDAARDALTALQGQLITVLAAQNATLAARVAELEERLARLERAASRNSGNSSLPPSMDDQPGVRVRRGPGRRGGPGVAASHQEIEIPQMVAAVIQHDLHEVACRCGRVHRAAAPAGAAGPGTVTYGIS